jgi:hypothetical protein
MKKKHHHKKKPGFFKKWSAKLHLWFGLGIGFLIFIISITGALYVFKDEIENLPVKMSCIIMSRISIRNRYFLSE